MKKIINKVKQINLLRLNRKIISFISILGFISTIVLSQQLRINQLVQIKNSPLIANIAFPIHSNTNKEKLEPKQINSIPAIYTQGNLNRPTVQEFPLGWYHRADQLKGIDIMAEQGFNLIMPYVGYANNYNLIRAYLDRASDKGIKVLLELYPTHVKRHYLTYITKYIRTFKDHPAVYGWYLLDEPILKRIQPEQLKTIYKIIKAETPQKPVALLFNPHVWGSPPTPFASYWNSLDIFMGEWYPSRVGENEFDRLNVYGSSLRRAKDFAGSKPFITVLQAFGRDDIAINRKTRWRYPTLKEERYMIYNAISSGTKGLFFFAYDRASSSWTNNVLMPLVKELKVYLPAIINGLQANKASVNQSNIDIGFYLYPNQSDFLIIAVNHKNQKIRASFSLSREIASKRLQNTVNQEQIPISDHQFIDDFDAYGVNIYRGQL